MFKEVQFARGKKEPGPEVALGESAIDERISHSSNCGSDRETEADVLQAAGCNHGVVTSCPGSGNSGWHSNKFGVGVLIFFIRIYQLTISPWLPECCRFRPTCSVYAVEALRKHGVLKGGLLSAWRILRCNPFCKGGDDPVPEEFHFPPAGFGHSE